MATSWASNLRERRHETRHPALTEKPSILGRAVQRAAVGCAILLVAYGTLGPVAESSQPWIRSVSDWRWIPPARGTNLNDVVTNLAVYVPVGAALCLLARRRGSAWWGPFVGVLGAGLLSWATEFLQQFQPARVSSATDVMINIAAASAGVVVAAPAQRALRRIHGLAFVVSQNYADALLAGIALFATSSSMTAPWSLHRPRFDFSLGSGAAAGELAAFAFFAALGILVARGVRAARDRVRQAALASILGITCFAGLIEIVQCVFAGHTCGLRDFVWECLGGVCGVALAEIGRRRGRGSLAAPVCVAGAIFLVGMLLAETASMRLHSPRILWIPLYAEFNRAFSAAASDMFQAVVLSFCVALAVVRALGRRATAPLLLLMISASVASELFRALFQGHVASTTAPLLAAVGWLLAVRLDDSLRPVRAAAARSADAAPSSAISSAPIVRPI